MELFNIKKTVGKFGCSLFDVFHVPFGFDEKMTYGEGLQVGKGREYVGLGGDLNNEVADIDRSQMRLLEPVEWMG